ncbi:MAG TPA: hypothetical protein VFS34_03890 [Thermoanaerobaculia bacterium]|nr:hypothetical protein [Thermoanaerobaculia bacterium]
MKRKLALLSIATLLAAAAFAQPPASPGYDASKERHLAGTVEAVTEVPGGNRGGGLHVTLASGKDRWEVRLGPKDFSRGIGLEPAKGDSWEVTGSAEKTKVLIAREIRKGDKTYRLRDARGFPLWSHGRR